MSENSELIHPIFEKILKRSDRELMLEQRSKVVWFTGLSGSGKSTLAIALEKALYERGYLVCILDGDNIRSGINSNLSFSEEDRKENIRRIAEVNKLIINCGVITLNCFISPTNDIRDMARHIINDENYVEFYVSTPLEVCEQRDVKGLYKKARSGLIKDFTGVDATYEAPLNPHLSINTADKGIEECVDQMLAFLLPLIRY